MTSSLWFYSKDEATDFNNDTGDNNESFEHKAKFLDNTVAQPAPNNTDRILKSATIALPLKYLNDFWRSRGMPLINCITTLKFKWTMYCVLAATGANNADTYSNNIIFTIKDIKVYVRAGIIKYYNVTINGKTFYNQQVDMNDMKK